MAPSCYFSLLRPLSDRQGPHCPSLCPRHRGNPGEAPSSHGGQSTQTVEEETALSALVFLAAGGQASLATRGREAEGCGGGLISANLGTSEEWGGGNTCELTPEVLGARAQ